MPTQQSRTIEGPGLGELLEEIGYLFEAAYGAAAPDDMTGENVVERLALVRKLAGSAQDTSAEDAPPGEVTMANPLGGTRRHARPSRGAIAANTARILKQRRL